MSSGNSSTYSLILSVARNANFVAIQNAKKVIGTAKGSYCGNAPSITSKAVRFCVNLLESPKGYFLLHPFENYNFTNALKECGAVLIQNHNL